MVSASFVASPEAAECGKADLFSATPDRKDKLARCKNIYPLAPGMSFTLDEHAVSEDPDLWFFTSDHPQRYTPFCADFGPVKISVVHRFCTMMRDALAGAGANRHCIYCIPQDPKLASNAAFLLAAFLVIHRGFSPVEAARPFARVDPTPFVMFRDATHTKPDYHLSIFDCLKGLAAAMEQGWYSSAAFAGNLEVYELWDDPSHGDLHQINEKFVAFKGPVSGAGMMDYDHLPSAYCEKLRACNVTAVVRLNDSHYCASEFTSEGFRHHDLFFEDCSVPSLDIVEKFLNICDQEDCVAVHCYAGLGRTGTLIALWMMKHKKLTANECIAWLRIVRPGSVIGGQQSFLKVCESLDWDGNRLIDRVNRAPSTPTNSPKGLKKLTASAPTSSEAARAAKQITEGLAKRFERLRFASTHPRRARAS